MKYKKIFHSCIDTKHIITSSGYYNDVPEEAMFVFQQEARFFELYKYYGSGKKEIKKATFLKNADIKSYFNLFI